MNRMNCWCLGQPNPNLHWCSGADWPMWYPVPVRRRWDVYLEKGDIFPLILCNTLACPVELLGSAPVKFLAGIQAAPCKTAQVQEGGKNMAEFSFTNPAPSLVCRTLVPPSLSVTLPLRFCFNLPLPSSSPVPLSRILTSASNPSAVKHYESASWVPYEAGNMVFKQGEGYFHKVLVI